ncbi:hypothetical protein QJS04_geneDACA011325 [Acorus gramineus]|uniref:Tetratricopeptide repeat (TPR)-like superfamily protein n=1 Tax=Acorus gramineus TaxID=55184 RepID=A0AAV9AKX1_ACOGR|nr:hypothetical protein QJS04_geneDACA011325 [Acorus gramineus]
MLLRHAFRRASPSVRSYSTNVGDAVALQMVRYALSHARSQKSEESYGQSLLVLELGLSSLASEGSVGLLSLAMSTLLYERRDYNGAIEKLERIRELAHSSLGYKVAACEALVGMNLEIGQDVASSALADECLQLFGNKTEGTDMETLNALHFHAKAIKGLVDLVCGDVKSAELCFSEIEYGDTTEGKGFSGNMVLSHGEMLHVIGNHSSAEDFYKKALQLIDIDDIVNPSSMGAANMVPEEVILGATCALGQLLTHSRQVLRHPGILLLNFHDAEEMLTKALGKAEDQFGSAHPKVGIVLTCIALMYGHKARLEGSSSILIQEQNRKAEGERMRKWADAAWRNRRLSLAQVLDIPEPSGAAVVDTRICRVL